MSVGTRRGAVATVLVLVLAAFAAPTAGAKPTLADKRGLQPVVIKKDGSISFKTALAAFDKAVAEMPGVEPRKGEVGRIDDASFIIAALAVDRQKMTAAQLKVYEKAITPEPDAVLVPDGAARRAPASDAEGQRAIQLVSQARAAMVAHGYSFPKPILISFLDDQGQGNADSAAYTTFEDVPPSTSPTCNVFVTALGRAHPEAEKPFILAHETAHCAQHAFLTTQVALPPWVTEGSANWLGASAVIANGGVVAGAHKHWRAWLEGAAIPLFQRSYDAIGFFAMLDQAGIDTWERIKQVLNAAANGNSFPAYVAATSGAPPDFFNRWGPGLTNKPAFGAEWVYQGPGIIDYGVQSHPLSNGGKIRTTLQSLASTGFRFSGNAEIVLVESEGVGGGLLRGSNGQVHQLGNDAYCHKAGGCKCEGEDLGLPELGTGPAHTGFNAAENGEVLFEGMTVEDFCKGLAGPQGIMVFKGAEDPQIVARFKRAKCSKGEAFKAKAADNGWKLTLTIDAFNGFNQDYAIPYAGPDPEMRIQGPDGTLYSNLFWEPGFLANAGQITFPDGEGAGKVVGATVIEIRNQAANDAVGAAGLMRCKYPRS